MPSYIGFRPQFNPVSLQDYLAVPTMVLSEYGKAEDVYNETATKAEALKALLGERNADNEAGWRIVDNYERQLGDLADSMSKGIQGPETYRQAKNSLKFYRENMLPLESGIPAYQKELEKWNADPTMIGSKPALESYIKNPLYRAQMMSGNAIQAEAMKAAATASDRKKQETKDRLIRGGQYYSYYDLTGFSPDDQQAYYLNSDAVPELKQLEDSITDKYVKQGYNDSDARRYAKLGIIEGITYDRKRHDAENKAYNSNNNSSQGNRRSKKENDLYSYFMSQSLPSPDYGTENKTATENTIANKMLSGPVTTESTTNDIIIPFAPTQTKTYKGTLSASADFYSTEAAKTEAANKSNVQILNDLNETFGRNARKSYLKFNDKSLNTIKQYGKSYFGSYKTVDDIPTEKINNFINSLRHSGNVGGMLPSKPSQEQINLLVDIGFSGMQNSTRRAKAPSSNYLTEKEFNDLKNKGVEFYNPDGSVKSEQEILWDAWDKVMPKQYNKYSITTTQGAGKNYGEAATKEYLDEFPNSGEIKTNSGKTITLKPNKDRNGFVGFGAPQYYLSGRTIRHDKKIMTITSEDGKTTHTIDIPLSRRDKNIIYGHVRDIRAEWLTALVSKGIMTMEEATALKNYSIPDFLKYIELVNQYPSLYGGKWASLTPNIDEIIDELDDALVIGNEMNFIPGNSETEGKLYK